MGLQSPVRRERWKFPNLFFRKENNFNTKTEIYSSKKKITRDNIS